MDELEAKLLEMIGSGVTTFEPALRTSKELLRFQEMTRVLPKLEREGLIHRCLTVESEIAGQSYFCVRPASAEADAGRPAHVERPDTLTHLVINGVAAHFALSARMMVICERSR